MRRLLRPGLVLALGLVPAAAHAQLQGCETYIDITDHPPSPYYYGTTANITVHYGDVQQEPACLSWGGSGPSSFHFTINGIDRTSYFDPEYDVAAGTDVPLYDESNNVMIASITGYDAEGTPRTDVDTVIIYVDTTPLFAPTVDITLYHPRRVDYATCFAACFTATAAHMTVPYFSLDAPHSVTLVYNEDRTSLKPFAFADVAHPFPTYAPLRYELQVKVNGAAVPFVNGESTLKFAYADTTPHRIGGQFDASSYATGAYPMDIVVTSVYTTGTATTTRSSYLVVLNERASSIARGWTIAGWQRLYPLSGGSVLIAEGDGSSTHFLKSGSTLQKPAGDFTRVTDTGPSDAKYVRAYPDSTRVTFNSAGRMVRIVNRFGDTTTFAYDGSNRPWKITDPTGVVTTLSYGSYGLASIKDPFNRYTYVTVVSDGRLTGIQDPDGVSTAFGHDGSLRLQTITDRAGKTTTLTYDSQSGKLASVIAPTVAVFQKGNVNPTTWFDPWQKDGVPYTATVDNPFPSPRRDSVDALVRAPDSTVTRYRDVDRHGQPRYALLPLGQGSTANYNVDGQLTSASSSFGPTATYTYDASGFLTHAAVDNVDVWQRNGGWGQPDSLWGDIAPQRVFLNPANGRVDSIRLAGDTGLVTNLWYDAHGRIQYARDPEGHLLTYAWYGGTNGNRSKDSLPGGRVATYLYDTYGRDTSVSATGQPTRRVGYDSLNRPIRTYDGAYWTYFAYDSLYLKSVTDAKNQVYQFSRNALGAVTARIDPAGRQEQYEYGLGGELRRYVNRRGQADTLAYDSLLRRTVQSGGNSTPDTLGYSANGRVITGKSETTIETVYLNVRQQPDSIRTVFRSDTTKRFWRRFTYDTAGRVFEVKGTGSALSFHDRKYVRNASSGLLAVLWLGDRYTGGIGYNKDLQDTVVPLPGPAHRISRRFTSLHGVTRDSSAAMYDRYHYDELHRIDRAGHSAGFLSGKQHVYGYDGLGRLSSVSFRNVLGCMWTFDPDAGYYCFWLEQDSLQNFTHDQVGNRTDHGGTYDVGNRITAFDNCTYGYDYDGNVTSRSCPGQTVTFTWNARNQLVSYVVNGDTVKLRYDAFGRLVRQWGGSVPDQRFLWERGHLFAALNSGLTAVEAEYSYYPGVDKPHAMVVGTTQYFMHTDGVGNVVGMTDTLKRLKRTYVFDAWGRVVAGTDSGNFGARARPRFKGALWFGDAGVELYYMRNRWYEPKSGRFLSEDPIGFAAGVNPYAFSGGDPVNFRDPLGLLPCEEGGGNHYHHSRDTTETGEEREVFEVHDGCGTEDEQAVFADDIAQLIAYYSRSGTVHVIWSTSGFGTWVTDVTAGFGDAWTWGGTASLRGAWGIEGVRRGSAYQTGQVLAAESGLALAIGGIGHAFGWTSKVAYNGAHHAFGSLGRLAHFQINIWRAGVEGSHRLGGVIRILLPWR